MDYPLQCSWSSLVLSWWRIHQQCGRPGFYSWAWKIPGEGKGYQLQYSGLESAMKCIVHRVANSRTWLCIGDWNATVRSQETSGVTGKFGFGVQNEAGQRLIEFCQDNALVIANTLFQQHKEYCTHGHHQMVNTKIRLIILFAAKDEEALYRQQKQGRELTMAQIMNSLLLNSYWNCRKWRKPLDHSGMT